jgi:hypothetical protein
MPPEILAGEAAVCSSSLLTLAAVAYVYQHNTAMNGWQADVDAKVEWVALNWYMLPNVAPGAWHVFSEQDLRMKSVQRIIRQRADKRRGPPRVDELALPEPIYQARCENGLSLYFY